MTQPPQWPEQPEQEPSAGGQPPTPPGQGPPGPPPPGQGPLGPPPPGHETPPEEPPRPPAPPPGSATPQPLYPGAAYGAPPPPPYGYQPHPYPAYAPAAPTNGLSIASMVVAIAGAAALCCYGVGGYLGAVGAILGHVAKGQIRKRQESGDGMALAGIIVGWIATGFAVIATVFWVLVFATPELVEQFDQDF